MFKIKICGITNVADAQAAARAGADAIGLNFYPRSPRYLDGEVARQILRALPAGIARVGLFVNDTAAEVCQTFDQLGLDLVQLHGDEPPEMLAELGGRPAMRAFRLGPEGTKPVLQYLQRCRDLKCLPRMTLIDAYCPAQYGGTGALADWDAARSYPREDWYPPLVLAGGLTAANVAAAIRTVRPAAVDTASGVEAAPRQKDHAAMAAFVRAARQALGE